MEWKKITMNQRDEIQSFLKNKFETSDLNFTNLLLWGYDDSLEYSIKSDLLYFRGNYKGEKYFFAPISKDDNKEKIVEAIKEIKKIHDDIVFVPKQYLFLNEYFELSTIRNLADYIYNQEDLATLNGRKYSSKRNRINKFMKTYNFKYEKIDEKNIEKVIEFQKKWLEDKQENKTLISENIGIEKILKHYKELGLRGGVITVDDNIVAYSIGEKLTENIGVIHVEKGATEYPGSYQMINMFVAKEEFSDVKYINREDDYGDLGLREAKMSYHPSMFFEKYYI